MLSKTGLHAVKALTALAELPEDTYAGAALIARDIGAPQNYLGKMLQAMARDGLVISQKGLNGGFRLARDAAAISLLDIIEPIEHVSRWSGCFLGNGTCSSTDPCSVHVRWGRVRDSYLQFLKETTIADLVTRPVLKEALV